MAERARPRIKPMEERWLDPALELTNNEGWDYRLDDLERLRELSPQGNLVALDGSDRPVGYLTALDFPPLGLIGNVVTLSQARNRGVASHLVRAGLEYLEQKDCPSQRLFSYTHTAAFYHRQGFQAAGVTVTLQGEVPDLEPLEGPRPYTSDMLPELLRFDRNQVEYDRSQLLGLLLRDLGHQTLVSLDKRGSIDGYLVVSGEADSGSKVAYEVGPWVVAPGCGNWKALLENTIAGLAQGEKLELSVLADNQRVIELCAGLGIGPCFSTIDMLRGSAWEPNEQNVLARAGLVKG